MSMRGRTHRRRGSAYLLVLGVAMLLTVSGIASVLAVRAQRKAVAATTDAAQARLCAQAGIEFALLCVEREPSWRTSRAEGVWVADMALGNGSFTVEVNDLGPSTDLASSSDGDPILLTATGFKASARHKMQVRLVSPTSSEPLTCLQVVMQAGGDITFDGATVFSTQTVSTNGNITANSAAIQPYVEAGGIISGGTFFGGTAEGVTPRTIPDPATVFDYYIANGTTILISDLPDVAGVRAIQFQVLSPAVNPYGPGTTNPQGIYVIDCGGQDIKFRSCRIVGTLVLLNVGAGSLIQNAIVWDPAVAGYPALLVDGNMSFRHSTADLLNESSAGINFNPIGTPDASGDEDTDTSDTYATLIKGLVYVSGDVETLVSPAFEGVLVAGGTVTASDDLELTYDSATLTNPPPGFGAPSGTLEIAPGSWAQVVD